MFIIKLLASNVTKIKIDKFQLILFFLFASIYAIYGLLSGNDTYSILKEFIFFSIPLIIFILLINFTEDYEMILDTVLKISLVLSIIQIILGIFGLFHYSDRYHYRHMYVISNTGIIQMGFVLSLSKVKNIKNLFSFQYVLIASSLILTLARNLIIFVFLFIAIVMALRFFGMKKSFFTFFTLFIFSPIIYIISILNEEKLEIKDTSILWRIIEWISFFKTIDLNNLQQIFLGTGFGASLETVTPLKLYNEEIIHSIDRFHNFYLYLFFKTGILGSFTFCLLLIIYLLKLYGSVLRNSRLSLLQRKSAVLLLLFISYKFFVESNFTGFFTMSISEGVLLGLSFALLVLLNKWTRI